MSRARAYCFTLNNYTDDEIEKIKGMDCRFLQFGKEVGASGTPHLQGYVYFDNAKSLPAVKKLLGKRVHLEVARGSVADNVRYTGKDGDVYRSGNPPNQGERTDLEDYADRIKNGARVDDIAMEKPMVYHQYGRTLSKIEDLVLRRRYRTEMTIGVWYYGETGVGKSHVAFEGYDPRTHYNWKYDGGWQDGYTGQEVVIVNEFRGQIPMCDLLMLVDKWPYELRRRGREPVPFLAKKVIVTSSLPPDEVYHNMGLDKVAQLLRRFTVIHLTERYEGDNARTE